MQTVLKMGDSVEVPNILLVGKRVVIYVTNNIGELLFVSGKDIPAKFIEQFTLITNTSELEFTNKDNAVPVFHIPALDLHIVSGWTYEHIESGKEYKVLSLGNADRIQEHYTEYPLTVLYQKVDGKKVWSRTVGSFAKDFRKTDTKQNSAHLRLVYSAAS